MRLRQSAALTAAAATTLVAFPSVAAAAEPASTLYVNNRSTTCTDAGSGTAEAPYCTISAAAHAAQPGQTVQVAAGSAYQETVTVTNSGTPDKPITFVGLPVGVGNALRPVVGTKSALVLSNVHDVVVKGFRLNSTGATTTVPVVSVVNSSRVVLDQIKYSSTGPAAVQLSGSSDHVTVSRSQFRQTGGVSIGAGVHDALITGNEFSRTSAVPVSAVDAPNTAVTNNTIVFSCGESVKIDGASPGALVENNVITAQHNGTADWSCGSAVGKRGETEISISAGSTAGSKVDYNTVHPWADASAYTWGGASYPTAAAFTAAQPGQAAHDVDLDLDFPNYWEDAKLPESAVKAIDSTDPTAPGVDTDLLGVKPTDDPNVANGAAGGLRDRGAYELTGQTSLTAELISDVPSRQAPAPYTVKVSAKAVNSFNLAQADYLFDFGDGSEQVHSAEPTVSHTYTKPGTYWTTVTATDTQGGKASASTPNAMLIREPGDLKADVAFRNDGPLNVAMTPSAESPYAVTKTDIDFGDGAKVSSTPWTTTNHQYSYPGSYTVTVTATDEGGRTTVVKKTLDLVDPNYTAALEPGLRVQLLGQVSYGGLSNAGVNYTKGVWSQFAPVPQTGAGFPAGTVTGLASATTADQWLRAFALVGGRIYTADRNLGPTAGGVEQGHWLPWKEVTGTGALSGITQISAASIGNSTHIVAVANGRVYEASSDRATGKWSAWGDVTGATGIPTGVTSIAAGATGNVLHIAILGTDGHIRVADGDYTRGRWSFGDVTAAKGGPRGITQLAAASTPGSRFHVVALAGGRVYETTGDYQAGYWTGWGDISSASGISGYSRIAVASTGNTLQIYGTVWGDALYSVTGDYTAGRWTGGFQINTPQAAGGLGTIDILSAAGF
ncbi:PKD domain-containing protein [Kitasatospora sp. NPDC048365]|uniref:PKD domain-containing protein n=1 Tax=Kitasatospora sp. NPDC048365 TaxID=3364050 RepID=UPI003713DEED